MDSIMNIYLDDRYPDISTFASPRDCISDDPIQLLSSYTPMSKERRGLIYTSLTGAKTGWSLFHLSNRPNWELRNSRTFWHAMDMKFQRFLKEYRELRIHCNERSHLGVCPGATHAGAAHANARQNARGGRCLNNCTKGGKYALHDTLQNALVKALNGDNIKAVAIEAHPYSTETNRTDISISSAETPDEVLFYVDTTITNKNQNKIPKLRKLTVENDDLDCCQNLLMNTMVVNNHIFQASKLKLQKYKRSHESARANGSHSNASIVPFAVDTLGNFCSVAITFLKAIAKTKFAKISNKAEVRELAASNWISTTCRDIQTAIIKTCAYNNRFALKCAFGESYNELYPGTIYSPPSYDAHFPSAIMSS